MIGHDSINHCRRAGRIHLVSKVRALTLASTAVVDVGAPDRQTLGID
ncbi:MAG: hypothetical protein ABI239_10555 [Aquihabitans sp.]